MFSKKTKNMVIATIVVILAAAIIVGIVSRNKISDDSYNDTPNTVTEDLPKMSAYYKNTKVGTIYGYTNHLEESLERKNLVVIAPNRDTTFKIKKKGNEIKTIKYEVKSTEDGRLVDNGAIEKLTEEGDVYTFVYHANAIIEMGKEYRFRLIVSSNKHEEINYYCRIIVSNNDFVEDQIKFIKKFSNRTFTETENSDLAAYLESSAKLKSNDNLGNVNINSSYQMLIWGSMSPKKIGKTSVTTRECTIRDVGNSCTYTLNYQIQANNAQKVVEKYNVSETYTVWTSMGKQYMIGYSRDVDQVWEPITNNIGNAFIDFGIQSMDYMDHVESANGRYIAFSINGDIYEMDVEEKVVYQIYKLGFDSSEKTEMTKTKAVNISNKGVVDYMIYGYSYADSHKGRNGISIMRYNPKEEKSVEKAFIPCSTTAKVLEKQLQTLCHVGDGTLYIMFEDTIYYANLKTQEWGTIANNLENDSYAVSGDGKILAYNTDGSHSNSNSITLLNLDTGKKRVISANEGEKVSVCGFTGPNLVYGIANAKDVQKQGYMAMKYLVIVNDKLKEVKRYTKHGAFVTGIEIKDNIINIKRKNKSGKSISDDQILDNTESSATVAQFSYYTDDVKQKEVALSFSNKLTSGARLSVKKNASAEFGSDTEIDSTFAKNKTEKYYVYGFGRLQDICSSKSKAIELAKKTYGIIVNSKGKKIWTKEEHYKD